MMIKYAAPCVLLALSALAFGCGGGLSTEDAQAECDELRLRQQQCFEDTATINACVACFEDCGVDCDVSDACPATFSCE